MSFHIHPLGLRRSTTSNLLDTELVQVELELLELLGEIILALSPELTSLDLGRLEKKPPSVSIIPFRFPSQSAQRI